MTLIHATTCSCSQILLQHLDLGSLIVDPKLSICFLFFFFCFFFFRTIDTVTLAKRGRRRPQHLRIHIVHLVYNGWILDTCVLHTLAFYNIVFYIYIYI